jgi:hypothetical protein
VKSEEGENQSVQPAKPFTQNATTHHTQTTVGTIGARVDNLGHADRRNLAWNLDSSFLSVDEQENIIPKTPEVALVIVQA